MDKMRNTIKQFSDLSKKDKEKEENKERCLDINGSEKRALICDEFRETSECKNPNCDYLHFTD